IGRRFWSTRVDQGRRPPCASVDSRPMKTILVVDDAPNIVELVRMYLEGAGYATLVATDGRSAVELHRKHRPDLVILDVMLTARTDDIDAIVGLELGADDYVTKPFNPRALVARVKAILRRTDGTVRLGRPVEVGTLRIEPRRREVTVGDRAVDLRAREFDLLAALARDPGVRLNPHALLP